MNVPSYPKKFAPFLCVKQWAHNKKNVKNVIDDKSDDLFKEMNMTPEVDSKKTVAAATAQNKPYFCAVNGLL